MALVKFRRGKDAAYSYNISPNAEIQAHKDTIYFATDKGYLYVNGVRYGGDDTLKVRDVVQNENVLTVMYTNGTSKKIDILEWIPKASEESHGLLSASDKTFINDLIGERNAGMTFLDNEQKSLLDDVRSGQYTNKIESVSGNILEITDKNVTATVSLIYDDVYKRIKLLGKDHIELGSIDTTMFVKDGILEDVSVVTIVPDDEGNIPEGTEVGQKYVKFTWRIQNGEAFKYDYIAVSEFAKTYFAGTGIQLTDSNEISVVLAESTESKPNYLTVNNGLCVSEIGANSTKINSEIQIKDGLLAEELSKLFKNGMIPKGTSVEEILLKLICKEIYPTTTVTYGKIQLSMELSEIEFDTEEDIVEVGTLISTNQIIATDSICEAISDTTISGFSNGYYLTEDGEIQYEDISVPLTIEEISDIQHLSLTYTGFDDIPPEEVTNVYMAKIPKQYLIVQEGECTVTANATGTQYNVVSPETFKTYYNVSNLENKKFESTTLIKKEAIVSPSKSTTKSITGVYKYFLGYSDFNSNQQVDKVFTASMIRDLQMNGNLNKDSETIIVGNQGLKSNGQSIVIAIPSKYKLQSIENEFGGNMISKFSHTGVILIPNPINSNFKTYYNVYVYPIAGNASVTYKNLVINKA